MLQSFHGRIGPVPVLFAHTGAEADNGNRVYAVGAVLLHPDRAPEVYASPVRYRSFSLRDRRASNLSRQEAESAPEMETVVKGLEAFFGPAPFVVVWSQRDNPGDLERLCGGRRTVDLGFVAEYFLPDLESFSPKTLWERLHRRRRDRLSFHADEAAALGVDLLRHICVLCLDSTVRPEAAALRHFLERSDTLFGKLLLHLTQNRDVYFGELAAGGWKA
jgi:ATP-dependent DNA helicase DinG